MKKIFIALMLCFISIISVNAQNNSSNLYGYTTNCLVFNNYTGNWEAISDGYGIEVVITSTAFYVNSRKQQSFLVYNVSNKYINKSGHEQYTADAIDQDGSRCNLRVVFRDDAGCEAPIQIYIHYNNIDYVYNIVLY